MANPQKLAKARLALTRAEKSARGETKPRIVTPEFLRYVEMRKFMRVACGDRYGDEIERWQAMILSASKFQTSGDVLAAAEWLTNQFQEHGGDDLTAVAIGAAVVDLLEKSKSPLSSERIV